MGRAFTLRSASLILPTLHTPLAVLFDIDGTLLDTFDFIYGAFEHSLALHGAPVHPRPHIASKMGGPLEECYRELAPGFDHLSLTQAHRDFQSTHVHLARLFPGTRQVLEYLKSHNYKVGAITTRSIRTSVRSLEENGIDSYFDLVLSFEDVMNVKPDPEPLLTAAKFFGVKPSDCMMVGDTYADILCGKNAGASTVAALYGFGGASLRSLEPDATIDRIDQLLDLIRSISSDRSHLIDGLHE